MSTSQICWDAIVSSIESSQANRLSPDFEREKLLFYEMIMMNRQLLLFLLLGCLVTSMKGDTAEAYWPQWRGPSSNGTAPQADPPVRWSETENICWKIKLPGMGHSTPIIWADRIFLLAAIPFGEKREPVYTKVEGRHDNNPVNQKYRFVVMAISRKDGELIWQVTVREEYPHEGGHYTGSLVSNSPVTDGKHLYAFFGSRGLYCLDFEGNMVWQKDLGRMESRHAHGEGASAALHGEMLVVNWDHQKQSSLMAFNTRIGKQIWSVKRDEMTSWSTPLIVEHEGHPQVVVSATGAVRGYDLKDGSLIWECRGLSRNVVASPVAAEGMVYVANSYDWQALMAIRLDGAKGDITETTNVVWKLDRLTPYVPSPLLVGRTLFFMRHNQNILSMLDARTGKNISGPFRLGGIREVFASPVAAGGRVYITDRSGNTIVFRHHDKGLDFLGVNHLDDHFSASAAVVGKELYLRGEKHLYCIAEN